MREILISVHLLSTAFMKIKQILDNMTRKYIAVKLRNRKETTVKPHRDI